MLSRKKISTLIVAGTIIGFSGCGQNQQPNFEETADSYLKKNDFLKAIQYYEKSLADNKDDKELLTKLEKAKLRYSTYKLTLIKNEFTSKEHSLQLIDNLKQQMIQLQSFGNNALANSFLNELNEKRDEINGIISKHKEDIYSLKENKDYQIIIETLNKILVLDTEFNNSSFYTTHYGEADNYYYNEILKLLNTNALNPAAIKLNIYNNSFKDNNKKEELKTLLDEYASINNKLNTIKDEVKNEKLDSAMKNTLELVGININNKVLMKEVKKTSSYLAKAYLKKAQTSLDNNQIATAYFHLLNASKVKNSVSFLTVSKDILNKIYEKANMYKDMGLDGTAYALYSYVNDIDKNFKSTFIQKRDVKDILLKRNILKLAISEFVTPSLNRNAGTRFTASLTSNLFKNTTKDVQVIERNRLKHILDELKLQETGNIESLAQQRGKIKGINVFVFGDIVESSIDPQRVETKVSKKIQIGTRKITNPLFMIYFTKSKDEQSGVIPEQFIEEPEYQIISYVKGKITKTVNLVVSIRIVDIQKGEIISAKTFEKQNVVSDKYNEGVEFAGITSDPERIDSDKSILAKTMKEMIDEISDFTLKTFLDREKMSSKNTEYYLDRREYEKAMEEIINNITILEIKNLDKNDVAENTKDLIFKKLLK